MDKKLTEDQIVFKQCQADPAFFVRTMRGLTPQQVLPEFQEKFEACRETWSYSEMEKTEFEPFIKWKHISWQQWEYLECVRKAMAWEAPPRIAIRSWHGIGKSASSSWLILRALFWYYESQVACTAPSAPQLKSALRKEVYTWIKRMPEHIQELYERQSDHVRRVESPWNRYARAKTGKKETPEALAWVHSESLVFALADEASWVEDVVYEKMEWAQTWDNNLTVMISNPTRNHWYFYDAFNKNKKFRQNLHFSCENSPLNTADYINYIAESKWVESDAYAIMVKWDFPEQDWVDSQWRVPLINHEKISWSYDKSLWWRIRLWVDPSWDWWDKTQRVIRNANRAIIVASESISNEKWIADRTHTIMTEYNIHPQDVYVDNFWVWANVAVELAYMWVKVNWVNVWNKKDIEEEYLNKRAEAFWRVREWINSWWELVNKTLRIDELPAIKYKRNIAWKIQIMGKQDMKKNFGFSPDKMDALMLTFYDNKKRKRRGKSGSFVLDYSHKL